MNLCEPILTIKYLVYSNLQVQQTVGDRDGKEAGMLNMCCAGAEVLEDLGR